MLRVALPGGFELVGTSPLVTGVEPLPTKNSRSKPATLLAIPDCAKSAAAPAGANDPGP